MGVLWRPGVYNQAPLSIHAATRAVAALAGVSALLGGAVVCARRVRP